MITVVVHRLVGTAREPTNLGQPSSVLLSRSEAIAAYGRRGIDEQLTTGSLLRLFRDVYVQSDIEVDPLLRLRAAMRSAGPGLVAVRESAALVHGFGVLPADAVHLAGPPETTARGQPGLHLHGLLFAPGEVTEVDGLPVTTAERTVVDLARTEWAPDALAVVDAALRIGACTPETLAARLVAERTRRGIVRARRVVGLGDPLAESPMESRTRMRILDARLPAPRLQWEVCLDGQRYRLDLAWPEQRVAVEYDGAVHLDRDRQRHDIVRRARLAHAGWRVLWATDVDIYRNHRQFVRRLADLLHSR